MKKTIIKGISFILIFLISLFVISRIMNQGNTDLTVEMGPATYPIIYMKNDGLRINELHGYLEPMKESYLRETITPLGEGRGISLEIQKYYREIDKISFEVRSADGERLVESTVLNNYEETGDILSASFTIKDLIEEKEEYNLIINLGMDGGETLKYYTRIIQAPDYHATEKLSFVKDFHDKTFDKEAAKDITKYLESNSDGDNTNFNRVDIHSNFNQITWGDLAIDSREDEIIDIKELDTQTGSFKMSYRVTIKNGREDVNYLVDEFYRVRYTADRMYLLDFVRTMKQLFDETADVFINNKIVLGITDQDMELFESDGGNICVFINQKKLYSYNVTDNKFAVIYGFYDNNNMDARTLYDAHEIKVLDVDETGNVQFMVYGYMNRGRHEGRVGVQVCRYSSVTNTVEEAAFLPYTKSYEVLKADIDQLAYVNRTNQLYLMLDNSVYKVDLDNFSYDAVVSNLSEESYKSSETNTMLVWQEGGSPYDSKRLILLNLNTREQTPIEVSGDDRIAPLGFMGEDLIYGIAREQDIVEDSSGRIVFPMYAVKIYNEIQGDLKTYQEDNVYTTGCLIESNRITLERVSRSDSQYVAAEDDHILYNEVEQQGVNVVEVAPTEKYEKIVQIAVKSTINSKNLKLLTPREVLFEGGREIYLENDEVITKRYYVYGKNGIEKIYTDPGNAIKAADSISGVVVADNGGYVWKKGNRSLKNQIMKIQEESVTEEKNSLAVCLDTVLKYEGVSRNTEYFLNRGETAISILEEQLPEAQILDLSGCSLDSILYYVNRDIPVLGLLSDGNAVLIIGFNELNTVLMDPQTGKIFKKGMNDSMNWFEENGNCFITYLH